MDKHKNFEKFKAFIELFDKSINTNDLQQLHKLIPLTDNFEEYFLSGYHRRKKEGTFYTNRELSDFIVKETLLCLVNKKLNEHAQGFEEIFQYEHILKQKIINILLHITICDPACGSGGFLLSAAHTIYKTILKLSPHTSHIQIKNQIIKNLFGFDINEYAIKLCILKLLKWYTNKHETSFGKPISTLNSNLSIQNSIISSKSRKFDIIIGNPPYGNILNQKEKEILKNEKIFYKDIYCAFLLKALEWCSEIIGFLVPKSFLLRQGYINFRNEFLSKAKIIKIFDIGSKMFKRATNEVQIIIYKTNGESISRDLTIYDYPKNKIITYPNHNVDSLNICFNLECPRCLKSKKLYNYTFEKECPFCGSKTVGLNRIRIKPNEEIFRLIEKIEKIGDLNYLNHLDFPKMIRGEEETGLKIVKRKLRKDTTGSCFYISARNDFNYYTFKKNKTFNIEELNSKILKGYNYEYYLTPKLLIKHNNIIPEAIFTEDKVCFTSSIYSLLHKDVDELKYLCGVLNSILIQFYCVYAINNQKDTTINLNQYMIRHLPIIRPDTTIKNELVNEVDKIYEILNVNTGDTNRILNPRLRKIDEMLFKLYSIDKNEKEIIISSIKKQIRHFYSLYKD